MTTLLRPLTLVLTAAVLAGGVPQTAAAGAPTPAAVVAPAAAPFPTQPALDHRETWSETDVTALPAAAPHALLEGRYHQHSDLTPTGRFVRAGDALTFDVSGTAPVEYVVAASGIFSDLNGGVKGLNVPASTPLPAGSTSVTAASDGLVYLRSVGTGATARVRVTGGAPQPVFQLGATTDAAFDEQMARWSGSRFVLLLGERMIGEFQRSEVDQVHTTGTWDPAGTIANWDRAADLVAEAHGMDPAATGVARPAGHRIRIVNPDTGVGLASATQGVITFQVSTGAGQRLLTILDAPNQWVLWHEVAHTYQNRAYRWEGMAEVQGNLYASHAQRALGLPTRYTPAHATVKEAQALFARPVEERAASGASHELMFEQLAHAFGSAFYPRLNQEYRVLGATVGTALDEDDHKIQQFIRIASRTSGHDLSEFFRQWGLAADATTLEAVRPLADLPHPIWTELDPAAMPLVRDTPAYVLPTGTLDGAGLPDVTSGWSTLPAGWRDRVRGVGSIDGTTPARTGAAGVLTGSTSGHLWVELVSDSGVREVLTAPLVVGRGSSLAFRGIYDRTPLTVALAADTSTWAVMFTEFATHDTFGDQRYLGVELVGADGHVIASASAAGNESGRAIARALHGLPAEDGQYLRVFHGEPRRLDLYVDGTAQARATTPEQAFRVAGGQLHRVAADAVAAPPVLTAVPGLNATTATLTMSASVYENASRHVVRHGGAYAFEIHRGTASYGRVTYSPAGDTVTVTRFLPAGKGDLSLHRVAGAPGDPAGGGTLVSTHPTVTTQPTSAQLRGVLGVDVTPSTVTLHLSGDALASDVRHLVFVNGTYVLGTHQGTHYGSQRTTTGSTVRFTATVPRLSAHDVVEVRLASGLPGDPQYGVTAHTYRITPADIPIVLTPR